MARLDNSVRLSDTIVHYHTSFLYRQLRTNTLYNPSYYLEYVFYIRVDSKAPGQLRVRKVIVHSPNEIEAYISLLDLGFEIVNYKP